LRAIAIAAVIFHHLGYTNFTGGYIGVDIFFVISGYLITGKILEKCRSNEFTITQFYIARSLRLLPALYLMLAVCLAFSIALLSPHDLIALSKSVIWTLFFSSNIHFGGIANYFNQVFNSYPLMHTWSLAIEEQFYIIAAPLLSAIFKRFKENSIYVIVVLATGSVILSQILLLHHPSASFFLPFSRGFELLIGAILVFRKNQIKFSPAYASLAGLTGATMIGTALFGFDKQTTFPGINAMLPCLGTALIIASSEINPSLVGKLLSWRPLVYIGSISYSLYLWHWPVQVLLHYPMPGQSTLESRLLALTLTCILGTLSYHCIEQKIRHRSWSAYKTFLIGIVATSSISLAAIFLIALDGMPGRFTKKSNTLFDSASDYNPSRDTCHGSGEKLTRYSSNCIFGAPNTKATIAVWGDSMASELAFAMGEKVRPAGRAVMQISSSSCPPSLDYLPPQRLLCASQNAETLAGLIHDTHIRQVALVANYQGYPEMERGRFLKGFAVAAHSLHKAGKQIILIYPIPNLPENAPRALGILTEQGKPVSEFGEDYAKYKHENAAFVAFLDQLGTAVDARSIHPDQYLCRQHLCHAYEEGWGVLFYDDTHLSLKGARRVLGKWKVTPPQ
jgi:peptidoglycan/LPS O-acetylase OafA/YrhL